MSAPPGVGSADELGREKALRASNLCTSTPPPAIDKADLHSRISPKEQAVWIHRTLLRSLATTTAS